MFDRQRNHLNDPANHDHLARRARRAKGRSDRRGDQTPLTSTVALMTCRLPGASLTALSAAFAVSMQSIPGHSSSPKSDMALAFSVHGFHTTVEFEPLLDTTSFLPFAASLTVTVS